MHAKVRLGWAGVLMLLATGSAMAQSQSGQDCAHPGGCGSSSKPGGTEHRPSMRATAGDTDAAGVNKAKRPSPALGSTTPSLKDVMKGATKPSSGGTGATK